MEKKNHNSLYVLLGILTLVVAITGATFAYFTATAVGGQNVITGNMATITFKLFVEKKTDFVIENQGLQELKRENNELCEKAVLLKERYNVYIQEYALVTCVSSNHIKLKLTS